MSIHVSAIMPCGVKELQGLVGLVPDREEDAPVRNLDEGALEGLLVGQALPGGWFQFYAGKPVEECELRDWPRRDCPLAAAARKRADLHEAARAAQDKARPDDSHGVGAGVLDGEKEVGRDAALRRQAVVEKQAALELAGARVTVTLELLPGEPRRKDGRDGGDKADKEVQDFHAPDSSTPNPDGQP